MKILIILVFLGSIANTAVAEDNQNEAAVRYLMEHCEHPDRDDELKIRTIAQALEFAAYEYNLPGLLLISMAWFESRFRSDVLSSDAVEKAGEQGILQVGKQARIYGQCDMNTVDRQAVCGAIWFRVGIDSCDGERGLVKYIGGKSCNPKKDLAVYAKWKRRIKLWEKLEALYGSD
jgi:hypothetical protein